MTEPKLTEAQKRVLDHAETVGGVEGMYAEVARMVADAEQAARAEAWSEGYQAGAEDQHPPGTIQPNPYREATP